MNDNRLKVEAYIDYGKHGYINEFVYLDDMYCPSCGTKNIWMEDDNGGDYYEGETHVCVNCKARFTIPTFRNDGKAYQYEGVIDTIKKEIQ